MIDVVARECVNHVFVMAFRARLHDYETESRDRSTSVNGNGNSIPICRDGVAR